MQMSLPICSDRGEVSGQAAPRPDGEIRIGAVSDRLRAVLFAGGGTGGHVYMAVSLRDELKRRFPGIECLFVGTSRGLETRILPAHDFRLRTIEVGGLVGTGFRQALKTVIQLPSSVVSSWQIVRDFSPRVVVGLGGYSSGPVVVAARLRGVPAILIEPNVLPGLTNRWLARWASGAAVAFTETAEQMKCPCRVTGIPIREEFHRIGPRRPSNGPLRLLVFGGSQGSRPINRLVCRALSHLSPGEVEILHQTGESDHAPIKEKYGSAGVKARVVPYIKDMPRRLAWADLVLCRAGASTVAEITAAGRPAILIPFPQAADDHQRHNARMLESKGAARLLEQSNVTGVLLAGAIKTLAADREELARMALAARKLSRPGSAASIVDFILEVAGDSS